MRTLVAGTLLPIRERCDFRPSRWTAWPSHCRISRSSVAPSATLGRIAREQPRVLACMHGSAWRGDGASLLRALARSLASPADAPAAVPIDLAA